MVDLLSPSTGAKPHQPPPPSPRKGRIPIPPPSPFDPIAVSIFMDRRNLGNRTPSSASSNDAGFDASFVPPPHPIPTFSPSVSASGKASSATGLSKPRLVKVRRHLASPRVKPVVASEAGAALGFNPFRSGPMESEVWDQQEESKMREQPYSWNRLDSQAGAKIEDAGSFESASSDSAGFVFGAVSESNLDAKSNEGAFGFTSGVKESGHFGRQSSENLSFLNSSSLDSVKFESAGSVFGASSVMNSNVANVDGIGNSNVGSFIFGTDVKEGSHLSQNPSLDSDAGSFSKLLPDEMRKLNLQSLGSMDGLEKMKLDDCSPRPDGNIFIFGSCKNPPSSFPESTLTYSSDTKVNLSQKSSLGSDDNSFSKLPEEMRKLNLQIPEKTNADAQSSKAEGKNIFIFGNSKNPPTSFGCNMTDDFSGNTFNVSKNLSCGSDGGLFCKLPDEMRKLNLQTSSNESNLQKNKQHNHDMKVDRSHFVFDSFSSSSLDNLPEESSHCSQNSALDPHSGPFSKLPEEMRKLKLRTSGNDDSSEKVSQPEHRTTVDGNESFAFGIMKNGTGSFGSDSTHKLPEEMKKLNIDSGAESKSVRDESRDFSSGVFVFGSSVKKMPGLSQTTTGSAACTDKILASELSGDIRKLKAEGLGTLANSKGTDHRIRTDVSNANGFVFGSEENVSYSPKSNVESTIPLDFDKFKSDIRTESFHGFTNHIFMADSSAAGACTPSKSSFQEGKQNDVSSMGTMPTAQKFNHFRTGVADTSSSHSPSPKPSSSTLGSGFTFSSMHEGLDIPHVEFKTSKQDESSGLKENVFSLPHQNMEFSVNKAVGNKARVKKHRGKLRHYPSLQQSYAEQFPSAEKVSSPADCSPMDCSPYHDPNPLSREASMESDESIHLESCNVSTDIRKSDNMDDTQENLASATQQLHINECDDRGLEYEHSDICLERSASPGSSSVDIHLYGVGKESFMSPAEHLGPLNGGNAVSAEAESNIFRSNIQREASQGRTFPSEFSSQNISELDFKFAAASSSGQGSTSAWKRHLRRKDRTKAGHDLYNFNIKVELPSESSFQDSFPVSTTSVLSDPMHSQKDVSFLSESDERKKIETSKMEETKQRAISPAAASVAAQETCEKWRHRGNQAYAKGNLSKAEEYYTRGVNSVSAKETSISCLRVLMLCYSNRAATRMSLGRMREAVGDCMMATAIDPSFLRAKVRAANCYLALGETVDAIMHFKECMKFGNDASVDRKILREATDGLQKAQQLAGYMDQCAQLLLKRTSTAVTKALQIISEALLIGPYSERLVEVKAEALLMLRNYEEVIQLCEQTLESAEKNCVLTVTAGDSKEIDSSEAIKDYSSKLWRWRLISRSYFYLGRLEEALELLEKHERVKPIIDNYGNSSPETSSFLSVTVRELLRLKTAGNEAFQAGRHMEAVEHYTAALACNIDSRPFAAICFCNRAAAYQALGQITDAIADCTLAIALDASYPKAISRRATLHEMIRDCGHAINDLNRLISLLQIQLEKDKHSGSFGRSTSINSDLKRARLRLSTVEEEARKGISLDMYLILGIEQSSSAADVKKAYRKAALRHHPDKVGQFLARNENIDDGLWKEMADEVHTDADRLFKMIGEAYTILSDPTKRLQYDAEEEVRSTLKKGYNGSSSPKTPSECYSGQYERSNNRRQWREGWKPYGESYQRSSESSRSSGYY